MSDRTQQDFLVDGAYSLHEFGAMIASPERVSAYVAALERVVGPDTVVVEVGAGAGFFSLLACRMGARRVYAIEANPIIEVARALAADNGMADRLVCIDALSTQVTLPEPADVLLADLRGVLPFYYGSVESIVDARTRLLKPGGAVIPQRDTLWAAVVQAPESYEYINHPWTGAARGLNLTRARTLAVNGWTSARDNDPRLLSAPAQWSAIDYRIVTNTGARGTAVTPITAAATAHGVAVWFDAELGGGIGFSNAPGAPRSVYGRAFFPWVEPQDLAVGDVVETTFHVLPGASDSVWTWETRILDAGGTERAAFRQSTFLGGVFSTDRRQRAYTHVPTLSVNGAIERDILSWIDGRHALGDIASRLHEKYPTVFADWNAALGRAAEVSGVHERHDAGTP